MVPIVNSFVHLNYTFESETINLDVCVQRLPVIIHFET